MSFGFSYQDAYHMSLRDYRRYASINAAYSIPADQREGGVRRGTASDAERMFVSM